MNLRTRVGMHLAVCAAASVAVPASAAVVYSGVQNLTINSDLNGLYLNVVTGAYNVGGGGSSTVPGDWHINVYGNIGLSWYENNSNNTNYLFSASDTSKLANLPAGTRIDGSSGIFQSGQQGAGTSSNLTLNGESIVGFTFDIGGFAHYGWLRVSLSNAYDAQPRSVVDWAYESDAGVGILAGATGSAVPGGGLAGLILTGFGSAAFRRRR